MATAASLLVLDTTTGEEENFVLYARSFVRAGGASSSPRSGSAGRRPGRDGAGERKGAEDEAGEGGGGELPLYRGADKDGFELDGVSERLRATKCSAQLLDMGGLLMASNDVLKSLTGQPARTMVLGSGEGTGRQQDPGAGVGPCHVTYADVGFAVFALVLPQTEERGRCQFLLRGLFDLLVYLLGPTTPQLARWGPEQSDIQLKMDTIATRYLAMHQSAAVVPFVTGSLGPADVFDTGVGAFNPTVALRAALDETLNELEGTGLAAAIHLGADGLRTVLPVGACLMHRGVLIVSHLGTVDQDDAVRLLRHAGLLWRRADEEVVTLTRKVAASISPEGARFRPFDACSKGPWSDPPEAPRRSHSDAHFWPTACPHMSHVEDRVVAAVAEQDTILFMVHRLREDASGVLDPYLIDPLKAALLHLRSTGVLVEISAQIDACAPATVDAASAPVSVAAPDTMIKVPDDQTDVLLPTLTSGGVNVLLQYVSFGGTSGCVLHPIPNYEAGGIAIVQARIKASRARWVELVNNKFCLAVGKLRSTLQGMLKAGLSDSLPAPVQLPAQVGREVLSADDLKKKYPRVSTAAPFDEEREDDDTWLGMTAQELLSTVTVDHVKEKADHGQELGLGESVRFEEHPEREAESVPEVVEAGSRFRISTGGGTSLDIWVVGRLLHPDREAYVCYDATAVVDQEPVEMAFRMLFGSV